MKVLIIIISILTCFLHIAEAKQISDEADLIFDGEESGDIFNDDESDTSFFSRFILDPMRLSFNHELSYKIEEPVKGIKNNRSSIRLEYSKFFLNYFFLQVDSKLTAFWRKDHRSKAEDNNKVLYKNNFREAFLQASFLNTSIKAGIQVLIWGVSDGGAITDVISPRDYSEAFFISLEDSRIGQPMIILDQFSKLGTLSIFFNPEPSFNEYPEEGTEYYYDPFNGSVNYQDEEKEKNLFEYGARWKKSFGKSDIGFMAASLIDNDYTYRFDGIDSNGDTIITKVNSRYTLAGMTFNYVIGNFLFKGEVGYKSPKSYNDSQYQILKKDAVDSSLGLEYSSGGTFSISLEAVNKHIRGWSDEIQGIPQDTYLLVLSLSDQFFNEDLSLNWMTTYNEPYAGFLHVLTTSYKWDDNITFYFNTYYPVTNDKKSNYWIYRDQRQFIFKTQLQI